MKPTFVLRVRDLKRALASAPDDHTVGIAINTPDWQGAAAFLPYDWNDKRDGEFLLIALPSPLCAEMEEVADRADTLGELYEQYSTYRVYRTRSSAGWMWQFWPASEPTTECTTQCGYVSHEKLLTVLNTPGFEINRNIVTDDPVVLAWLASHPAEPSAPVAEMAVEK